MANSDTAVGIKDTPRTVKHPFNTNPPHHERVIVNDDNWGLAETALPVHHPNVASHRQDVEANTLIHENHMNPVTQENQSAYITSGRTRGK